MLAADFNSKKMYAAELGHSNGDLLVAIDEKPRNLSEKHFDEHAFSAFIQNDLNCFPSFMLNHQQFRNDGCSLLNFACISV